MSRRPIVNALPHEVLPESYIDISDKIYALEQMKKAEKDQEQIKGLQDKIHQYTVTYTEAVKPETQIEREKKVNTALTKMSENLPHDINQYIYHFVHPKVGDIILTSITEYNTRQQFGRKDVYGIVVDTEDLFMNPKITFIYITPSGYSIGETNHYESPKNIEASTTSQLTEYYKEYVSTKQHREYLKRKRLAQLAAKHYKKNKKTKAKTRGGRNTRRHKSHRFRPSPK